MPDAIVEGKTVSRMSRVLAALVVVAAMYLPIGPSVAIASAHPTSAETLFITSLGTLGGRISFATAVNFFGDVVGSSSLADTPTTGPFHAFLWRRGVMTDLGHLGGGYSTASSINRFGVVVGSSTTSDGEMHGFRWQNGVMRDLGTLGGTESNAHGINDRGDIVGWARTASGAHRAFLWRDGTMREIDLTATGSPVGAALAINNRGQVLITGFAPGEESHGYLWKDGVLTDLGTPAGAFGVNVDGLNDFGHVVGATLFPAGPRAFVWRNGVFTDLGTLGGSFAGARAINNVGQIVGSASASDETVESVLWGKGTITSLDRLLTPTSGLTRLGPTRINDFGLIVGSGLLADDPEGSVAFIARVIP